MQVDWRIGVLIIVAVLAILLVAGLSHQGASGDRSLESGGPPACPPGHVTSQGCSKP